MPTQGPLVMTADDELERVACPKCGEQPARSITRYGPRLDCCGLWAWGDNPLADRATHEARKAAHAAFDPLWKSGRMKRGEAYKQLAEALGIPRRECHIKLMTVEQASQVLRIADALARHEHRSEADG